MPSIVSVHSFRGGTGKSNITANLATTLALRGKRVGIVDTDIQSPGVHVLFGLTENDMGITLNDFIWGRNQIEEAALDVTDRISQPEHPVAAGGRLFLVPSSIKTGEIARVLREGYEASMLTDGFKDLLERLELDFLFIDTHPGLNEETLLSIVISDVLLLIMRPDQQDIQGTSVTVEVARKLGVPAMYLIVNKVPPLFDGNDMKSRIEQTYNCDVAAILFHSDEMMTLGSNGLFVLTYPDHPFTQEIRHVTERIDV